MQIKKDKTILYTVDDFCVGGVITFVKQYVDVALKHGYKVVIVGFEYDIPNPKEYFLGATIEVVRGKMRFGLWGRVVSFVNYYQAVRKVFRNNNVNVVHVSTTWSSLYTLLHWKTLFKKKIVTFYGPYDLEIKSASVLNGERMLLGRTIRNVGRRLLHSMVLSWCDQIVTFSDYARQILLKHYSGGLARKINVIPGYVIVKPAIKKTPGNNLTILNYGRAEPRKGIDLLLEACRILKDKNKRIKLIVASPVEYWQYKSFAAKYEELDLFLDVSLVHKVSPDQIKNLQAMADVFVMPSIELETFGMTILENLAVGIPVIGTPVGAIPEILKNFDSRFICNEASAKAIAKRLEWYMGLGKNEKEKISKKAVMCMKKCYSSEVVGDKYVELLSGIK